MCTLTSASYGQYSSNPQGGSNPTRYSSSPVQVEDSGVQYAQIADTGVTYAQVLPRADRAVPGPQTPIQVKVQDPKLQQSYLSPTAPQYQR